MIDQSTGQTDLGSLGQALLKANYVPDSGGVGAISQILQTFLLNGGMGMFNQPKTVDTGNPGASLGQVSLPDSSWNPYGS